MVGNCNLAKLAVPPHFRRRCKIAKFPFGGRFRLTYSVTQQKKKKKKMCLNELSREIMPGGYKENIERVFAKQHNSDAHKKYNKLK
ncbi:hypothetical protein POVWA2_027650 [Plasmodium ovale wallikeri]|uniref:Uncharacterized protein n=1 Tax=Plasmodium ovale wallikeri TaxID=864142 RepID=A0A1A8YWL5_PLAOA|nr:hypothetical protein POVWA1_027490 [Plasmodium ovale wallikeri]SBT35962.1 hypothetical protein POVWA2_027650 [Plasmodium ovale wallikeri]